MIETLERSSGAVLGFKMTGKLHDEDYKRFVPEIDAVLGEHEKIRLLAWFDDFHGWDLHALWDDIVFDATHCAKIDRVALVGDRAWEKWMAKVCKPFTRATVNYFDVGDIESAWEWIEAPA